MKERKIGIEAPSEQPKPVKEVVCFKLTEPDTAHRPASVDQPFKANVDGKEVQLDPLKIKNPVTIARLGGYSGA